MKRVLCFMMLFSILSSVCFTLVYGEEPLKYGRVYCRCACESKRIALTFDDGPHPRFTREILSILSEYGVTATFFIIGVNAERYPEAFEAVVRSGCEIGNHTYSHSNLKGMDREDAEREILRCEELLEEHVGSRPTLFRPPEGMYPDYFQDLMETLQYDIILWSVDTMDWAMNPAENIERTVLKQVKGGEIILMHDYVSGGNTTLTALRRMIPRLLSEGYEFVTVSELIGK